MKRRIALATLPLLLLATPAEARSKEQVQRDIANVRSAANAHCASSECVAWIMRTVSAESCFDPRAVNRNRNGSVDRGVAQVNSKQPPMPRVAVDVWNVDSSIRYMALAYRRGLSKRWYGHSTPAGCHY
jgi:hypothetical protein